MDGEIKNEITKKGAEMLPFFVSREINFHLQISHFAIFLQVTGKTLCNNTHND